MYNNWNSRYEFDIFVCFFLLQCNNVNLKSGCKGYWSDKTIYYSIAWLQWIMTVVLIPHRTPKLEVILSATTKNDNCTS